MSFCKYIDAKKSTIARKSCARNFTLVVKNSFDIQAALDDTFKQNPTYRHKKNPAASCNGIFAVPAHGARVGFVKKAQLRKQSS